MGSRGLHSLMIASAFDGVGRETRVVTSALPVSLRARSALPAPDLSQSVSLLLNALISLLQVSAVACSSSMAALCFLA